MITFYPRQIELWEQTGLFDFNPDITLTPKTKTYYKTFYDRDELIGFCKEHGVRLDDPEYPFKIMGPYYHKIFGDGTYEVMSHTLLGWLIDDFKTP